MKRTSLLGALLIFGAGLLRRRPAARIARRLDAVLRTHIDHTGPHPVHNILISLHHRGNRLDYRRGFGLADGTARPAQRNDRFKIASITKMMTAAVVLQLFEEGTIDLDRPVCNVTGHFAFLDFDTLHLLDGVPHGREITPRQLLNHTSGLRDLFTDSDRFMTHVMRSPAETYTPKRLIELYYAFGLNERPVDSPGTSFHYSDTGYVLLGLAIEAVTGKPLAAAYRTRIFEPLRMHDSWFEYFEPPAGHGGIAHAFYDRVDVTERVNTSYDWAGGGVVSTTRDLCRFVRGLFGGALFRRPETLDEMLNDPHEHYALGVKSSGTFFGHFGFWGSVLAHDPDRDVTLCLTWNQVDPPFDRMELIETLLSVADGADASTIAEPESGAVAGD